MLTRVIRYAIHLVGEVARKLRLTLLRLSGASIGHNTMISMGAKIDMRRGSVQIGNHCLITHGCYILSHDGAAHVIDRDDNGEGRVKIGDHVFVGVNAVILRNVVVGNHAVIAAGAVVREDVPEGAVVAGSPAKIIGEVERPFRPLPVKH